MLDGNSESCDPDVVQDNASMEGEQRRKKRKRSNDGNNAYSKAYGSTSFEKRESSGRPGTPHRYFATSYSATTNPTVSSNDHHTTATSNSSEPSKSNDTSNIAEAPQGSNSSTTESSKFESSNFRLSQVIHQHVNGLCIVTIGEYVPQNIDSIDFLVSEAPPSSAGEKRKRQSKLLRGKGGGNTNNNSNSNNGNNKMNGIVSPTTVIANLKIKDDSGENCTTLPIYACVWGELLELNHNLTPDVLQKDPLLDGYVAVILPTGPFPPTNR